MRKGQQLLGVMDISVDINAFSGQRESFELPFEVSMLESPYNAVFIRAPAVTKAGPEVEVLALLGDKIVVATQGNMLGLAFHRNLLMISGWH